MVEKGTDTARFRKMRTSVCVRCGMLFFHYVTEGQSHRCMQAEAFWSLRCDACSRHIPCSAVNSTIIKCMRWSPLLRRTQSIFSFNGLPGYPPEDHEPWPEHTASNHLRHEWKHKVLRPQGRCQEPFEPRRKQAVAWNGNKRMKRTGQAGPKDRKRQVRSSRIRKNKADNHASWRRPSTIHNNRNRGWPRESN